jgi:hypothetical protein
VKLDANQPGLFHRQLPRLSGTTPATAPVAPRSIKTAKEEQTRRLWAGKVRLVVDIRVYRITGNASEVFVSQTQTLACRPQRHRSSIEFDRPPIAIDNMLLSAVLSGLRDRLLLRAALSPAAE